jgi:hypothetical protein
MPTTTDLTSMIYWGGTSGTATLQSAINTAQQAGKPLFIAPGQYNVGDLSILSGANNLPFKMHASPGTVTLKYTTGTFFLKISSRDKVEISGIDFDANNRAISGAAYNSAISVESSTRINVDKCRIFSSIANTAVENGISFSNCGSKRTIGTGNTGELNLPAGKISDCEISALKMGVFGNGNIRLEIVGNHIRDMVIPPFLMGPDSRTHAANCCFIF